MSQPLTERASLAAIFLLVCPWFALLERARKQGCPRGRYVTQATPLSIAIPPAKVDIVIDP